MNQNAMAQRANQAYRGAAVTVPPLKAVVLLHNGAITLLRQALELHKARRYEAGHDCLMRATAILRGLSHHLDARRGGQMGARLYGTYSALILAALRAYGRAGADDNIQRIIAGIDELREAWEYVAATKAAAPNQA